MDGRHVKVLGRGNPELLGSGGRVELFLVDLVRQLGMRQLGQAHIYDVVQDIEKLGVEPFEDEGGVTGFIVLSTSHCSIHTWPLRARDRTREMFVLDVYSCRYFEMSAVFELLSVHFESLPRDNCWADLSHSLEYAPG